MPRKTVYQRIVQQADRGRGIRLTAAETMMLARDSAIRAVAENDSFYASMPADEREHAECYTPKSQPPPAHVTAGDCHGDGWYGCKSCWRMESNKP